MADIKFKVHAMPSATTAEALASYARHSVITDPRSYASLFDELPRDLPGLARVVQGLLIHPAGTQLYGESPEPGNPGWGVRSVADMVERLRAINSAPLTVARPPRQRLRANCRNFAVLLVAMLRSQGVPARKRVGFAGYLPGRRSYVHEVAEFWHSARARWMLVDPQMDEVNLEANRAYFAAIGHPHRMHFDTLDIRPGDPFYAAGEVWRQCRAGRADPDDFQVDDAHKGMAEIRVQLLQDLDALNKAELLRNDYWHALIEKPEDTLTVDDVGQLDQAAGLTSHADERFGELRQFYSELPYAQAVQSKLRALGLE